MGRPKKNPETKVKEPIVETPLVETIESTTEVTEQPEQTTGMTVKEEVVIPIVVKSGTITTHDTVKLFSSVKNKVIASAVKRSLAEKLCKENPNLKIVK